MRGLDLGAALLAAALASVVVSACGSTTTLTPDQIVAAFISGSQADTRTMHMEWQGTLDQQSGGDQGSGLGQMHESLTGAFDFNGPDYAGDVNITNPASGPTQTSYARVSGVSFINFTNSGWQRADTVGMMPADIDPMRGLAAADVTYEGPDSLDGKPVRQLRVGDPIAALDQTLFPASSFANVSLVPGGRSDFVVYVDANGIPVGALMALDLGMTLTDRNSTAPDVTYFVRFDYQFSLWGEPVTISPPQVSGVQPLR